MVVDEPILADFETEVWELSACLPHPENPRKHPKKGKPKWEALRKSLQHDYFDPLVVNKRNGLLVSGHMRREILLDLGETRARVIVKNYDDATHKARMIAANTLLGEWEETLLAQLAGELEAGGFDAAILGLTEKEMSALVECPATVDDTEQAEELMSKAELLQQKWKVQPGDMYQVGVHRLLCGRCESADNWQLLFGDDLADVVWCDPPYNVAYDASMKKRNKVHEADGTRPIKPVTILNDDMPREKYAEELRAWLSAGVARLKPGGAIYIAHAESYGLETRAAAVAAGAYIAQCLIWVKQAFTLGRQDHQWQHEPILYGWKPGASHHWQGGFSQSTVIDDESDLKGLSKSELITLVNHLRNASDGTVIREPRNVVSDLHPTVKPVRLVARQLWNSSRRGEKVLELFNGSGTTMAAAEQLKRKCRSTELDPKYVAVGLERMSAYGLTIEKIHTLN